MKKFHFPLERVREWREKQVAIEEVHLERLYTERRGILGRIGDLCAERDLNDRAVLKGASTDSLLLQALGEFRRFARFRESNLAREQSQCDERIAAQRLKIIEGQRKVRLLDKLKQKKHKAWTIDFEREIDEQAAEAFRSKWSARSGAAR